MLATTPEANAVRRMRSKLIPELEQYLALAASVAACEPTIDPRDEEQ